MKRNLFSLSHKVNFSCDQGELIPIGLVEVLPGDIFRHGTSLLIRLAPMLAPIFSQLNVTVFQFYVPTRIVWEDFEKFITGGPDGDDQSVHPYITFASGVAVGSLGDYFGIPPGVNNVGGTGASGGVSAIPFRMYAKIFNEWIRDEDLDTELPLSIASGQDTTTNTTLQNIRWEKDYFTAARPFEQKGPTVTIPVGNQAPVVGIGNWNGTSQTAGPLTVRETDGAPGTAVYQNYFPTNVASTIAVEADGNYPKIYADLSAVTGIPVTELRLANALQRFMELSSHRGSRYVEYLLSRFGVRSSDARLQRPELLSRSKQVVQISEVLATAEGTNTDVGDLKGHGIGAMRSNRYMRMFEEHGYVMTLMAVQPKTMYVQGLHKTWSRRDKYDYFQPETQFIGDQEILNKEIYAGAAVPGGTFGWTPRYQEYREQPNRIAGEFRTSTFDFWHQARIFSSEPALNSTFVTSNPTERVFAVPSQDVLYVTANHSLQARRVMSREGTPFLR
jgi:hypothetical protein